MIVLNKIALILELIFGSMERIGKPMEINFDPMKFCKCSGCYKEGRGNKNHNQFDKNVIWQYVFLSPI